MHKCTCLTSWTDHTKQCFRYDCQSCAWQAWDKDQSFCRDGTTGPQIRRKNPCCLFHQHPPPHQRVGLATAGNWSRFPFDRLEHRTLGLEQSEVSTHEITPDGSQVFKLAERWPWHVNDNIRQPTITEHLSNNSPKPSGLLPATRIQISCLVSNFTWNILFSGRRFEKNLFRTSPLSNTRKTWMFAGLSSPLARTDWSVFLCMAVAMLDLSLSKMHFRKESVHWRKMNIVMLKTAVLAGRPDVSSVICKTTCVCKQKPVETA